MENLTEIKEYGTFKQALGIELKVVANGFVRIGYLLKVARDTDILRESGYKTVAEFAQAEYGLTKDVVSRYIAINDRYSVEGYSDVLQDKYKNFGVAKLGEMLTLPEYIADNLTPDCTRSDIQGVKKELEEEKKISDLEVLMEPKNKEDEGKSIAYVAMKEFWSKRPRMYRKMYAVAIDVDASKDMIVDVIAPDGYAIAFARLEGVGKIQITIKGDDDRATFVNIRNAEEQECKIKDILDLFIQTFAPCLVKKPEEAWELAYGDPFPNLVEERTDKPEKRTESKISKPEEVKHQEPKRQERDQKSDVNDEHTTKASDVNDNNTTETKVAPVQQENKFELVPDQNVDTQKPEEKPEQVLNTECESISTTNISTSDNKRIVFEEIKTAADKMKECLDRFDITGAGRYLKDVNEIFNSLAADKDTDIPGQMNIEDVSGAADGREDS